MFARADAVRIPLESASCDLVIGSPPYIDARLYLEDGRDLGISRDLDSWVKWMLLVTDEALRVSRGLVVWVVAGVTRDRNYQPGPEGLLWEWSKRGGSSLRPVYWHRVGIPGSGHNEWYRADVEYCLAFKRPGRPAYADPKANGHAPKWAPGGEMSHRLSDGTRKNQWGGDEGMIAARGRKGIIQRGKAMPSHAMTSKGKGGVLPAIANPGNLIKTNNGGNHLGSTLAHESEAPYPELVPAFFIRSHCPPRGLVCDPFSGSGTTVAAAIKEGRRAIGLDLRQSQCLLGRRRINTVTPSLAFGVEP